MKTRVEEELASKVYGERESAAAGRLVVAQEAEREAQDRERFDDATEPYRASDYDGDRDLQLAAYFRDAERAYAQFMGDLQERTEIG